jgi:tripartite-type tricarboxylate transporter receptor subunit TctC
MVHLRTGAIWRIAAALLALPLFASVAHAQAAYPAKAIKLVVPYAPGGLPDTVARIVAQRLSDRLGQSVIVDDRPGANGGLAASVLASAPADGYQFLVTDGSMLSINPLIYSKLSYDPKKDFVPVALIARAPLFLALNPGVPASTLQELITYVKSKPGQLNYGSSGIGSTHHLTAESMKSTLGLDIKHIPYKGTGQSVPALVGGQVEMLFSAYPSLVGFVKDGRVKLVATNAAQRSALAPNVPAISELIPGFDFAPIVGILAPAGTPPAIIQKIAAEVIAVTKQPDAIAAMAAAGIDPVGGSPDDYARAIAGENDRYAKAIKAADLKPE